MNLKSLKVTCLCIRLSIQFIEQLFFFLLDFSRTLLALGCHVGMGDEKAEENLRKIKLPKTYVNLKKTPHFYLVNVYGFGFHIFLFLGQLCHEQWVQTCSSGPQSCQTDAQSEPAGGEAGGKWAQCLGTGQSQTRMDLQHYAGTVDVEAEITVTSLQFAYTLWWRKTGGIQEI